MQLSGEPSTVIQFASVGAQGVLPVPPIRFRSLCCPYRMAGIPGPLRLCWSRHGLPDFWDISALLISNSGSVQTLVFIFPKAIKFGFYPTSSLCAHSVSVLSSLRKKSLWDRLPWRSSDSDFTFQCRGAWVWSWWGAKIPRSSWPKKQKHKTEAIL